MKIKRLAFTALLAVAVAGSTAYGATEYTPTRGTDAGYTLKDTAEASNTGMGIKIPTYDQYGNITDTTTKYVDVKAKTYTQGETEGNLLYTYEDGELTLTQPEEISINDPASGQYINNEGPIITNLEGSIENVAGNFIGNSVGGGHYLIGNGGTIENIVGNFIANKAIKNDDEEGGILILNSGLINNISADFIGNSIDGAEYQLFGAIQNTGTINSIKGDFIGNVIKNANIQSIDVDTCGAAIRNTTFSEDNIATIGTIEGNFIKNSAQDIGLYAGGAIYNSGGSKISKIKGNFIGNSAYEGAAILNDDYEDYNEEEQEQEQQEQVTVLLGEIGSIDGNFVENNASCSGGAISNLGVIDSVKGNFIGNTAGTPDGWGDGGAISNMGKIGSIEGNFVNNSAISDNEGYTYGGAISNIGGSITINDSTFVGNSANKGGAIWNFTNEDQDYVEKQSVVINANTKNVVFVGNRAEEGAAIYNNGIIPIELNANGGNIIFENNNSTGDEEGEGTGIYSNHGLTMTAADNRKIIINDAIEIAGTTSVNGGTVVLGQKAATSELETLNVAGNTTLDLQNTNSGDVLTVGTLSGEGNLKLNVDYDGATGTMDKITVNGGSGTITLDEVNIMTDVAEVGAAQAVYLDGTARNGVNVRTEALGDIVTSGGKIYTITPDAETHGQLNVTVGNAETTGKDLSLSNLVKTNGITNKFSITTDDYNPFTGTEHTALGTLAAETTDFTISGGNEDTQKSIDGTLANEAKGGGIIIGEGQTLNVRNISEFKNFATAIDNSGKVNVSNVQFKDNTTDINNSGELNFSGVNTVKTITGENGETKIGRGTTIVSENGSVTQKTIYLNGAEFVISNGAVVNSNVVGMSPNKITNDGTVQEVSGTFSGNVSLEGGAVYNSGTINTLSGTYSGNAVTGHGGAIYNSGTINIVANDSDTIFTGNIANGESNAIYQAGTEEKNAIINLNANEGKTIVFNDKISGTADGYNKLNINNPEVKEYNSGRVLFSDTVTNNDINLYGGTLQVAKDYYLDGNNVTFNGGTFSMVNGAVGTANFDSLTLAGNTRFNADVDLVNKSMDSIKADEYGEPVGSLIIDGLNIINENASTKSVTVPFEVDEDIKNAVTLDSKATVYSPTYKYKVGYNSGTSSFKFSRLGFNPSLLTSSIGALLGGYLNQLNSYDNAFWNMDMNMMMTQKERTAYRFANRYASTQAPTVYSPTMFPQSQGGIWLRPYTTIESVRLRHAPKVDNIMYGTFLGGDSDIHTFENGTSMQYSGYIGYNGSHQSFGNNGIYQNGGMLGATAMLYKNDFFTALTANIGANIAEASTMFGHEDFWMFTLGVASKTGYNIELSDGKFIIQPNFLMSYSLINTFDYTNATGARIKADPINAFTLSPGIKFIGNFKGGWQPYAGFNVVWSLADKTDFAVNNIDIPALSVKPYFQYGIGLQKLWDERQSAFVQVLMRNAGRNGIAFNVGYKYAW